MNRLRPTVSEERLLEVRGRAKRWTKSGLLSPTGAEGVGRLAPRWKESGRFARVAFFFLTLLCVGAFYGIQAVPDFGPRGWFTALAAIGVAELLVNRAGFLRTGVEEALYIGGLYAFILGLPGPPRNEGLLLFAIATLVAGLRFANAFFVAGSVAWTLVYAVTEWDESSAMLLALAVAVIAAIISRKTFERPLVDRSLAWITLMAPPLAVAFYFDDEWMAFIWIAAVVAVALGVAGVLGRTHPPLVASLMTGAFVVTELTRRSDLALRSALFAWGVGIGIVAIAAERLLRGRRTGITSTRLLDDPESRLLELAGTIAIAPTKAAAPREPGFEPGGGEFGGGGASGTY